MAFMFISDPKPAQGNKGAGAVGGVPNGNGKKEHELLAVAIETSPADDSLAIEHSLLRDPILAEVMEKRWGLYLALWLPMMMLAVWVMVKVALWRLCHRRQVNRERFLLGPEEATIWYDKAHPLGKRARNGVTTSEALDIIYSILVALRQPRTWGERLIRFWLDQPEGQAVRNRLRLTYKALLDEFKQLWQEGRGRSEENAIRVLSLACGSAQATIEALAEFLRRYPDARISLSLVDLSESSLRRALRLAEARRVADHLQIIRVNLKDFVSDAVNRKRTWDVVEMVGFLDYRSVKSLVWICSQVRQILRAGGLATLAHIHPSPWAFVVRWVINWPLLVRRRPSRFRALLWKAGFHKNEVQLVTEPNGIYSVALCRRVAE